MRSAWCEVRWERVQGRRFKKWRNRPGCDALIVVGCGWEMSLSCPTLSTTSDPHHAPRTTHYRRITINQAQHLFSMKSSFEQYDPRTFRLWNTAAIKALQYEWDCIIYRLPHSLQQRIKRPVIALNAELSCWGRWQKAPRRLIELKTELLLSHPWYAVLEVFRHEIAHQIVDEGFPDLQEPPHGPKFRKVCFKLGTNPAASGNYPPLDERIFSDEEDGLSEESKLVVKVRKLLALSQSANEHEAEQALLKARELTEKYELSIDETQSTEEFYAVSIGKPVSRRDIIQVIISNILQDFYQVLVIWTNVPNLHTGKSQKVLMLHGTKSNLKIAAYAYDCIMRQIDQAWDRLLGTDPPPKKTGYTGKRDFSIGLLDGFRKALEKHQPEPEVQALVLQRRIPLENFFYRLYPSIRKSSSREVHCDKTLVEAGEKVGRTIVLHPGLERESNQPKQLNR